MRTLTIPLTKGKSTVIDEVDADLAELKWHASTAFYAQRINRGPTIDGKRSAEVTLLHRIILSRMIGRPLVHGEFCDHIDGDPLNNHRRNLRLATRRENALNRRMQSNNKTGYRGVRHPREYRRWIAYLVVDGKRINLGLFDTAEDAARAYDQAAREHFGEFARLNFPEDGERSL